ncbi:MAG: hypothetical protein H8K03_00955 [Nitrospira sp.]
MEDHPSQWIDSGMTCRELTDRASDYLEDRLSDCMKLDIGLHLASCVGCRAYVRQISLVRAAVALIPKEFPSPVNRLRLRQRFAGCRSTITYQRGGVQ